MIDPTTPSPIETPPDELVAGLAATMPTPTAPAAAPTAEPKPENAASVTPPAADAPRDSLGRVFDAAKFAANEDGSPRTDSKGRFFSNKLGKKPAAAPASAGSYIPPDDPAQAAPAPAAGVPGTAAKLVENATAETCIGLLQTVLVLIGEEEGILTPTEKELLRPPLLRVLAKYDIGADVLPPEFELALAVVAIVIERIKRGRKFATWFVKVRAVAVEWFFRRKGAAMGAQVRAEVRPDLVASLSDELRRAQAELAELRRAQPAVDPARN